MLILPEIPPLSNWIDNDFVQTEQGVTSQKNDVSKFIPVTSPGSGAVIGYCPLSTSKDVDAAVQSAQKAFIVWR